MRYQVATLLCCVLCCAVHGADNGATTQPVVVTTQAAVLEAGALGDPPISIHLNGVPFQGVVAALSKVTGKRIEALAQRGRDTERPDVLFSLDVTNKPFWEVYRTLTEEGVSLTRNGPGQNADLCLHLAQGRFARFRTVVVGGFLVRCPVAQRLKSEPRINLHWLVAADPRIRIRKVSFPPFSSVIDDRGHRLSVVFPEQPIESPRPLSTYAWNNQFTVVGPEDIGTKITTLQGEVNFVVELTDKIDKSVAIKEVVVPFEFRDIPLPRPPEPPSGVQIDRRSPASNTSESASPVVDRAAFAKTIAKVRRGMTEAEARQILGDPDEIRHVGDPGIEFGVPRKAKESWAYGTIRHLGLGTVGEIIFDLDGKVMFIHGGTGVPPAAGLVDEKHLRELLQLIEDVPALDGPEDTIFASPRNLIIATNTLLPLGEQMAWKVIEEYVRVRQQSKSVERTGGAGPLIRVLFDPPPGGHFPIPPLGPPFHDLKSPQDFPRFPLMVLDDVPLRLFRTSFQISTFRWLWSEVRQYHIRSQPLHPPDDLARLFDDLLKQSGRYDGRETQDIAVRQLLGLIDNVYHAPPMPDDLAGRMRWRETVTADVAKLLVRWNPDASRYVPAR